MNGKLVLLVICVKTHQEFLTKNLQNVLKGAENFQIKYSDNFQKAPRMSKIQQDFLKINEDF